MNKKTINQRVRELRDHLGYGRQEFADKTGIKKATVENIERELQKINGDQISAIVETFPEYAYWLTTGLEIPAAGQISPATKEIQNSGHLKVA
jgi:DNA-binding XRE family transcriptional regulator